MFFKIFLQKFVSNYNNQHLVTLNFLWNFYVLLLNNVKIHIEKLVLAIMVYKYIEIKIVKKCDETIVIYKVRYNIE